jgi:hypothetical protein
MNLHLKNLMVAVLLRHIIIAVPIVLEDAINQIIIKRITNDYNRLNK